MNTMQQALLKAGLVNEKQIEQAKKTGVLRLEESPYSDTRQIESPRIQMPNPTQARKLLITLMALGMALNEESK